MNKLLWKLQMNIERQSPGGDRFTLNALSKLKLKKNQEVKILNIGCGKGFETICLAKNINGQVYAVDAHEPYLEELVKSVEKAKLDDKVNIFLDDMNELPFSKNFFDVIWIEGSIHIVGFEEGINKFKKFLKPDGFMVISDYIWNKKGAPLELINYFNDFYPTMNTLEYNNLIAELNNYKVVDSYTLEENAWWENYFKPLRVQIQKLTLEHLFDANARKLFESRLKEINLREKYREYYGFAFYILKKNKEALTIDKKNKIKKKIEQLRQHKFFM